MKCKRIVSVLSAAALLCCTAGGLPFGRAEPIGLLRAAAAEEGPVYDFDEATGHLVISGKGDIPYRFAGENHYTDTVKKVTVGDGITGIGDYAFRDCTLLSEVTIGSGVTTIGSYAFGYDKELKTITIPAGVTEIGNDAFYMCTSMETVDCYPDPAGLTWSDGDGDDFKDSDKTIIRVPADKLIQYVEKFQTNASGYDRVRATFVRGLDPIDPDLVYCPAKEPDCKTGGNVEYFTSKKDTSVKYYTDETLETEIPAEDVFLPADPERHVWGEPSIVTPCSIGEDGEFIKGVRVYTCKVCGMLKNEEYDYSTDPAYVITIPATVTIGSDGTASVGMSIKYYGIEKGENEGDEEYNDRIRRLPFCYKYVRVGISEINGVEVSYDIDTDNPVYATMKLANSDDHQAEIDCKVQAVKEVRLSDYDQQEETPQTSSFNPLSMFDDLMFGYLDFSSEVACEDDSLDLLFDLGLADASSMASGKYTGTITFGITTGPLHGYD